MIFFQYYLDGGRQNVIRATGTHNSNHIDHSSIADSFFFFKYNSYGFI